MPAPNNFWRDTTFAGQGNAIQQKTAANNPDVFCESQGKGYRLPAAGEYNSAQNSFLPYAANAPKSPGHWSTYQDNDITKARKANNGARTVSGSLYNEWGNLSAYGNGWETTVSDRYWVTEPAQNKYTSSFASQSNYTLGRFAFLIASGGFTNLTGGNPTRLTPQTSNYVACVRDLVSTPSTVSPSSL
ncbi:hypothetical protein [Thorsellia anophelis]|uniref:Uncharacterized protein n=1 Tax=Thorsellia anophelis DSM 18579 TaxID=1123402 RepID=A0A1I0EVH3_9GAMM|nr:hypothetical protein [Thorsellia anophelis]SET49605.1 hypothetical protein SAMN02583745_02541 [Thorsellia anophelis DSM 18579]